MSFSKASGWFFFFCFLFARFSVAGAQIPTPASVLGHTPGDDFYLADYEDTVRYFHALAGASDKHQDVHGGQEYPRERHRGGGDFVAGEPGQAG